MKRQLSKEQKDELLQILKNRFEKNKHRHKGIEWDKLETKLKKDDAKLWCLNEMEVTGGEPDVIGYDETVNEYIFCDCCAESPKGRRSLCYDREALEARKEHKPQNSAIEMANEMDVQLLNEEQYRNLQQLENFDKKTSSWVVTPPEIRKLGGAIFCDYRYGTVFTYHNGAESYYAARGFRGMLRV